MSRRAVSDSTDSLELLLDTICNTFGAVIFISMLVALLVNNNAQQDSRSEPDRDPAVEAAQVAAEIQEAQQRVEILRQQLEQQELIKERFASQTSFALAGRIMQQTAEQARLVEQKSEVINSVTTAKGDSAKLLKESEKLRAEQRSVETTHSNLQAEMEEELELSGRTARIPQVRRTTKASVVYALDDDKLYRVTTPDQGVDYADCERTTSGGVAIIKPKSNAGVQVHRSGASGAIRQRFDGVIRQNSFIQIFVSLDSFAAFLPVKDCLVDLGLEYEVVITPDDNVELGLGESERESFVQ